MRVRNDISNKNEYKLSKHRFLELKHMCLQYDEWRDILAGLDGYRGGIIVIKGRRERLAAYDISELLEMRDYYSRRIELIEKVAFNTDASLGKYILYGVTHDVGYDYLLLKMGIPCCKNVYYKTYRKFFWLLNSEI